MNDALAVDIVLLPPLEVMHEIINRVDYSSSSPIRLNAHDCLPHISLAMGVIPKVDLETATNILHSLVAGQTVIPISLTHSPTNTTPDGVPMSEFVVAKTEIIGEFRQKVMDKFRPLLKHDHVLTTMFVSPPNVADISSHWVKHYFDKPDGYRPHITLGVGTVQNDGSPLSFNADRLALCHLGTYCTCRKILAEFSLE